jgi:hypothetical protein
VQKEALKGIPKNKSLNMLSSPKLHIDVFAFDARSL